MKREPTWLTFLPSTRPDNSCQLGTNFRLRTKLVRSSGYEKCGPTWSTFQLPPFMGGSTVCENGDHHGPKFKIIMEIVPIMSTNIFCSWWTEVANDNCSHHGNNFDGTSSSKLVTIMVTSRQTGRFVTICAALVKMCPNLGRIFKTVIFQLPDKLSGSCCQKIFPSWE